MRARRLTLVAAVLSVLTLSPLAFSMPVMFDPTSGLLSAISSWIIDAPTVSTASVTADRKDDLVPQAAFTEGNVVVYRVGSGSGSLVNTGNPVFLDEYTPSGVLVQSIAMPTTASGSNKQLIASGTASSEGFLTRSSDGRYLVLAGYASNLGGSTSLQGTSSGIVPRTIGRVDSSGTINTATALLDAANASNPRGAFSTNGTDLWISGGAGGIRYAPIGATTSTQLSTDAANLRVADAFNGQLYVSLAAGLSFRLATVGTGIPTTSGQTMTNLPGLPTSTGSPYGFFLADLTNGVPGVDTLYYADDSNSGTINKYSLVSGTWVLNNSVAAAAVRGLTATVSGTTVTMFATTGSTSSSGGGALYKLTDTSGYNANNNGSVSTIATPAANTTFRGVALAPVAPVNICDFCNLQFPSSFSVATGTTTESIWGQIFEAGVTESAGPSASVTAQIGYGPQGTDPRSAAGWNWFAAAYNVQVGNNDEYVGTFTAPAAGTYSYTYRFSLDGGINWTYADLDGNGSNPGLTFSTAQLGIMTVTAPPPTRIIQVTDRAFGNVTAGTTSNQTVTVSNTGNSTLTLGSTSLINNASGWFNASPPPVGTTIAAGGSINVSLSCSPPANATGSQSASLNFSSNSDAGGDNISSLSCTAVGPEMDVRGNNVSIIDGDTTPSAADETDLGSAAVGGNPSVRSFTIFNTGTANLLLTGTPRVVIGGTNAADFTVTQQPNSGVIPPTGSTTFDVTFSPSATGVRTATISIANNDADESPYDFVIQGTGANAGTLEFASSTYSGTEGTNVTLTLTRTGGSTGEVSVPISTANITALGGSSCALTPAPDYFTLSGLFITFPDGDADPKTFQIPICQDDLAEGEETFIAGMGVPSGGATVGSTSSATVTITDEDVYQLVVNDSGDAPDATPGDGFCETASGNGVCSLRAAIQEASALPSNEAITFSGVSDIALSGELTIVNNGTLSIAGPGASSLTIHGSFNVDAATVSISGLTLRNGQGPVGGAIRANNGSLTINGVYFFENFGAEGGAIFLMGGTHSIVNSTFESNLATGSCGAIANEVATLYIANSTFFFNAPGDNGVGSGGALCSTGAGSSTVLRNVTIWQNGPINAGTGGGIYVEDSSVDIGNSIIAGNAAPGGKPDIHLVSGSVTSAGNNLIGDNSGDSADTEGAIAYQLSDKLDIDPKLMLPATNGGQTRTVALMAGSPAIDAGNNSLAVNPADGNPLVTDQRGVDRILDGNGDSTATVDIGAYETLVPTAAPASISGRVATATGEPIRGASVTIAGGGLAEPRTVLTGTFGNYSFGDLQTGTTYVVTVSARRYYFSVPSRVVTLTDNVAGVDFVAGQQ